MGKLYFSFLVGDIGNISGILTICSVLFLLIYLTIIYSYGVYNGVNPFTHSIINRRYWKVIKRTLIIISIFVSLTLFLPSKREMMTLYTINYLEEYRCDSVIDCPEEYIEIIDYLTKEHPKEEW